MDCCVRVALACQAALIQMQVNLLEAYLDVHEYYNIPIKINPGRGDGGVGPGSAWKEGDTSGFTTD